MKQDNLYHYISEGNADRDGLCRMLAERNGLSAEKGAVVAAKILERFAEGKIRDEKELEDLVALFSAGEIDIYALAREIRCSVTDACDSCGCRC